MRYETDYARIVSDRNTEYLVHGDTGHELYMVRDVNELLECERDNVQKMMGELE